MRKLLFVICSAVLALGLSGCWGKAPIGKGKYPVPVVTRGWFQSVRFTMPTHPSCKAGASAVLTCLGTVLWSLAANARCLFNDPWSISTQRAT